MKQPLVLTSLLVLLAGCATQSQVTYRRGKPIKLDEPAPVVKAAPVAPVKVAPVAVKPAPAAAKPAPAPTAVAPAKPAPAPMAAVTPPAPVPPPAPAPAPVVAPAATPAPVIAAPVAPAPEANTAPISASRKGAIVEVSWNLPASDVGYKAIEIMRNDRDQAPGRSRIRAVRATVTNIQDTVPDASANYWYWLKLTRADGQVQNIGPVAAPSQG